MTIDSSGTPRSNGDSMVSRELSNAIRSGVCFTDSHLVAEVDLVDGVGGGVRGGVGDGVGDGVAVGATEGFGRALDETWVDGFGVGSGLGVVRAQAPSSSMAKKPKRSPNLSMIIHYGFLN